MTNLVLFFVLALIIGGACAYIVRQKKKGAHCIGCPSSGTCGKACSGCCGNCMK